LLKAALAGDGGPHSQAELTGGGPRERGVPTSGAGGPYSEAELSSVAAHCTEREDAAKKVERLMRKVMAASLLRGRIGEVFDALVTGAAPKGTWARLLNFPAEGRVVRGANGIDVGDKVRVRLVGVDVDKGYIDFERADVAANR
jgi:exoribonuclease-2